MNLLGALGDGTNKKCIQVSEHFAYCAEWVTWGIKSDKKFISLMEHNEI